MVSKRKKKKTYQIVKELCDVCKNLNKRYGDSLNSL